ncbi:MAG: class I SAM-dependent methyltransferase [Candidatus Auribacterota bacterium]|jgi:SAM-dependent methyltransferase|nr:class I SAM-dependent methyltransferase [Candidatus Auribacterota bacterium]
MTKAYMPIEHYRDLDRKETSYWWHISRLNWVEQIVRKICSDPKSLRALDYGCGMGGFLHHINERIGFACAVGVDVSRQAVENAAKYTPQYRCIQPGDVSLARNADIVFLMDVLEHIKHDRNLIESLLDVMPDGAYIVASVPAYPALFSSWDTVLGHYRRYSMNNLMSLFKRAGARIVVYSYIFSYLTPGIIWRRIFQKNRHTNATCEFPSVPDRLNRFLIRLNKLEIQASGFISIPCGSSILCMAQKAG